MAFIRFYSFLLYNKRAKGKIILRCFPKDKFFINWIETVHFKRARIAKRLNEQFSLPFYYRCCRAVLVPTDDKPVKKQQKEVVFAVK